MSIYTKSASVGRLIGKIRNKPSQLKAILKRFKKPIIKSESLNKRYLAKIPTSHVSIITKSKVNPTNQGLLHSGVLHRVRQYHEGQIANDTMISKQGAKLPPPLIKHLNSMTKNQQQMWRMEGLNPFTGRRIRRLSINWQRYKYGPKSTREHYKKIAKAFLKHT